MANYDIKVTSDLSGLQSSLVDVADSMGMVAQTVSNVTNYVSMVDSKVGNVTSEVTSLREKIDDFMMKMEGTTAVTNAKQSLVLANQELDKKFRYYEVVRKQTTGVLQAVDLKSISNESLMKMAEEVVLKTPNYWLGRSFIALTAWINNDKNLAERALNDSLRLDDENTSLLFFLIHMRLNRINSALVWFNRYLTMQDPMKMDLKIVFEDDSLLIINKTAGIPIHPSIHHYEDSLSNGVKYYFHQIQLHKKIRPVNRLDKDTSGLVVFAKNEYVQENLIRQMKTKEFQKEYLAILDGILPAPSGTISAPIARKEGSIIEREINFQTGQEAITHYQVLQQQNTLSLVKFQLETGRTHQIRVHAKSLGAPILGDTLYHQSSKLISRQALHAFKITFTHPILKKKMSFEIKLPKDMHPIFIDHN